MLDTLDLGGTWQITWWDGTRGVQPHINHRSQPNPARQFPAQVPGEVPGEVHLDLMRAGLIGDPCEGLNHLAARWVEETEWCYRRTIEAPAGAAGRCWLVFERLELYARVVLNGNFRRRTFDSAAAVFWMYNDVWPAVRSWTIIDHALNRTPAFHPVRRANATVSVVISEDADRVTVWGGQRRSRSGPRQPALRPAAHRWRLRPRPAGGGRAAGQRRDRPGDLPA
jgi:hypothetical protein